MTSPTNRMAQMDQSEVPKEEGHRQMVSYHDMTAQPRANEVQCHQPMQFTIPYSHFAIMYVDNQGEIQVEASPSVMGYEKAVFTEEIQEKFLKLANGEWQPSLHNVYSGISLSNTPSWPNPSQTRPPGLIPCEWQSFNHNKRHRRGVKRADRPTDVGWEPLSPSPSLKRSTMRVGDTRLLRKYYEMAFENFQQVNCKVVAKAYIKLVEPRKQVNYPYNGRLNIAGSTEVKNPEATKPKWWPSGVTHKEPDHLGKPERVRLLVHILCELRDSHDITAKKLREAGQDVKRQISPEIRLRVLDEIYYVREMEEQYLDGQISGDTIINVSHVHLEEELQAQSLASGVRDQLSTMPFSQRDHHLPGRRSSHRIMPTILDDTYQLPARSTKRPANSDSHLPISPSLSPSGSRKSSLERSMPTYSSGIDPAILSGPEPPRSSACLQGLQPIGATSIPEYFANQYTPPARHHAHSAFWDTIPSMHSQFSFSSY
ncbi:hypothetical protein ASPCAL10406 [Aspergillus calidoustus]|uniref:Subtelomeric hrmA-associated cluster protein AFUB-079030/YDR124W-like helical bundle domain-containing protein n=1 Tax=Aspergillus calidoustus TaxID=454130 RepID=A0A0U5G6P9_ASPCI|nr:hypothetical protein ASPCAL10406 [Aspergillus calidoustus]